ncbi:MAG: hypothetical protein Q9226_006600, partial [Calogaya cf. arnoldii]
RIVTALLNGKRDESMLEALDVKSHRVFMVVNPEEQMTWGKLAVALERITKFVSRWGGLSCDFVVEEEGKGRIGNGPTRTSAETPPSLRLALYWTRVRPEKSLLILCYKMLKRTLYSKYRMKPTMKLVKNLRLFRKQNDNQHISGRDEATNQSGPSSLPLPSVPVDFKNMMLELLNKRTIEELHDHNLIPYYLANSGVGASIIPVLIHNGIKYSLTPNDSVFAFHDDPEPRGFSHLRQIEYAITGSRVVGRKAFNPTGVNGAHAFLPLGHLVEGYQEFGNSVNPGRVTDYVWALDISTKPISLWLIYDYVQIQASSRETVYTALGGFLGFGEAWDVVMVFDNVDDWHPEDLQKSQPKFSNLHRLGPSLRVYTLDYSASSVITKPARSHMYAPGLTEFWTPTPNESQSS